MADKSVDDWIALHNGVSDDSQGFFSAASEAATKGFPLAVASGVTSILNTGIALGNVMGMDAEKIDLGAKVAQYDDDLSTYYKKYQEEIDLAGFIGTSIAPGMAGMKALKMLQGGAAGAAASETTGLWKTTNSMFGLGRNAELAYTNKAIEHIRSKGANELFSVLDKDKLTAIAAGFGEQALQGAAFQTGVLLSMNQSPVLSKKDEGYFTSLIANLSTIPEAAFLQSAIGGSIGAIGISGKLKQAVQERDIRQFLSLHSKELGVSDIDEGTIVAIDFSFLQNKKVEYAKRKAEGTLTEPEILNYDNTIKTKVQSVQAQLAKMIDKEAKNSGGILDNLWNMLMKSENPEETAATLFSAGVKIYPISAESTSAASIATKVLTPTGELPPRQAANIIERAKKQPEKLALGINNPTDAELLKLKEAGFELYTGDDKIVRLVPESKYARTELKKSGKFTNPTLVVKIAGLDMGRVTETASPVAGDLGTITFRDKDHRLQINGTPYATPQKYDPIKNSPMDANVQFLEALERNLPTAEDGFIQIELGNLPLLEAVARKGTKADVAYGDEYIDNVTELLRTEKLAVRDVLLADGHDFQRIARELNVSSEFAETGVGDFILKAEDHKLPLHVHIDYATGNLPDKWEAQGIASLQKRIQMAHDARQVAAASVLKEEYKNFPSREGTLVDASSIPDVQTFLTSASADYGSMPMLFQQSGKLVNKIIRDRVQPLLQSLQGFEHQFSQAPESLRELNQVINKFRASEEKMYDFISPEGERYYVPKKVRDAANSTADGAAEEVEVLFDNAVRDKTAFKIEDPLVQEYIDANARINQARVSDWNTIFGAMGSTRRYDSDEVYLPPINTKKFAYVNFVKEKMDLGAGTFEDAGVIVAPTAAELQRKVNFVRAKFGDRYDIITPTDVEAYKKSHDLWESGQMLGSSYTEAALKKEGKLYEFLPRSDNQIIDDINNWHYIQESNIVRQGVELKYAQEFAELRAMGQQFYDANFAKFGPKKDPYKDNPYYRQILLAKDLSNMDAESIWGKFNGNIERIGSKIFNAWEQSFASASKGEIDWVTANEKAKQYGFTPAYEGVAMGVLNPTVENYRGVQQLIAKANGAVSTLTLGLDFLNSLVNVVSFPILGLTEMRNVVANLKDPTKVGMLADITTVRLPGAAYAIPSPMKLLSQSFANFFGKDRKALIARYEEIGAIRTNMKLVTDVVDASEMPVLAAQGDMGALRTYANNLQEKAAKFAEVGKTVTGYNKAEEMVRFMAADMMRQVVEAAGVEASHQAAYINTFVNRVHGNYLANQRPHIFQGAVGQAISLFQTYQFNMMQNAFRYVAEGDKKTALMMLGLQNSLFGLQGNPAFAMLNQTIGMSGREHTDVFNATQAVAGKEMSSWLLYGLGSNVLNTSLYNRGDLTPRYVTVVPTQLKDIPAIAIPAKAIGSFLDAAKNIAQGGNVVDSMLNGIAHAGANRPLAGLAQIAAGQRTTNKGNLLAANNDLNVWGVAAKLAGGEELDRAIAFDAYYRNLAYKKADQDSINALGEAVKTTLYKGGNPTEEQMSSFIQQYTNKGGLPQSFNRWMMQQNKNANTSQLNIMKEHANNRVNRLQAKMMGADDMPDYWHGATSPDFDNSTP